MAQLTIHVNGKPYIVGCDDGEEAHLTALGSLVAAAVAATGAADPSLGETRLMLMGALMLADELTEAKTALAGAEAEAARMRERLDQADSRAATALEAAARKIEAMATR